MQTYHSSFTKIASRTVLCALGLGVAIAVTAQPTYTFGAGVAGQLGNGTNAASNTPVHPTGIGRGINVAMGASHGMAVKSLTGVFAWGNNTFGQLGNGTNTNSNVPVQVNSLGVVMDIAAGNGFSMALKGTGKISTWGRNNNGQLGIGNFTNKNAPATPSSITGASGISAGADHSLVLINDGTVKAAGLNSSGQLGDGTNSTHNSFVSVSSLTNISQVSAGGDFSVALRSTDGHVFCWGAGAQGQLGNGANSDSNTPVEVSGLSNVVMIAAGTSHVVALKSDGTVWCWGAGDTGQLGNGFSVNSNVPVQATGISTAISVAAGKGHSLALLDDRTMVAWGDNSFGQFGDGTNTSTNAPVAVSGMGQVTMIGAGGDTSTALKIAVKIISMDHYQFPSGGSATGLVTLNGEAPAGGIAVSLSSSDSAVASVPATVTVLEGDTTANFQVTGHSVAVDTTASITAVLNGGTISKTVTVYKVKLNNVTINPSTVSGGDSTTGTVHLSAVAPTGGITVALSSNRTAASVPATVFVSAGNASADFAINTNMVTSADTTASIAASYDGKIAKANLVIQTPLLGFLTVDTNPITGAGTVTVTIHLTHPSPTGGFTVSITDNSGYTSVPATKFIAAGLTTETFPVTVTNPPSNKTARVFVTYGGVTKSYLITINHA